MTLNDYSKAQINNQLYGGAAGQKLGININGENWFLKFPKSTRSMKNVNISYTTSPLSEYIGSHIYEDIGIDVHATELGIYDNKLVVACKDFKKDNELLFDFNAIKNRYSKDMDETSSVSSRQPLEELAEIFENNQIFKEVPELKDRFYDMFVVDALIGNHDRNNGNWGILVNSLNQAIRLAPVYDNGASFSNKSDDEKIKEIINDEHKFRQNVYESRISSFSLNEKIINPLKYIETMEDKKLNEAVIRIVPKINIENIFKIIDKIPNEYNDIKVISDIQRKYYKKSILYRYEQVLLPTYEKLEKGI